MTNDGDGVYVPRPAYMRESYGGCPASWRSPKPDGNPAVANDAFTTRWRERQKLHAYQLQFAPKKPAAAVVMEEPKKAAR